VNTTKNLLYYKKNVNKLIDSLITNLDNSEIVKCIFKNIVNEIFEEDCVVYIDLLPGSKYNVEIHFEDCNFYEIELDEDYDRNIILNKISNNLIRERISDKEYPHINRNNERYLKK